MPTFQQIETGSMHAYPRDLVSFLFQHWNKTAPNDQVNSVGEHAAPDRLPDAELLEQLISVCYHASLMREEERSVNLRLILREPERFVPEEGPPEGLHRLLFTSPRPFGEYELRRLSPAVDFYRSLVGIRIDPTGGLQIWGMVHSGTRWLQSIFGGRKTYHPLPPSLVIHVTGPGRIVVCKGSVIIASLNSGHISSPLTDVFSSRWLAESFADVRGELMDIHRIARNRAELPWATLEPGFVKTLAQQVVKRIINTIRNSRHGGTLVYLPPDQAEALCCANRYMSVKYQFADEEPRQRFRTLIVNIMNTFAEAEADAENPEKLIGWSDYVITTNEDIARLDEALFDFAHLIAGFAAIDGAVIMSRRHEVLGFGAVISGDIDRVEMVARALDIEGEQTVPVASEEVGTRHRAAYRLCFELHDALAIVISQDGSVRIVKWHNGQVTYWDQVPTGILGF
ncbi:MAG TPA: DNA integrity scanning protein DisA nucleotide-binding domain protein [Geobacteraceae bacterium]|nr:DNA integrity scanning protein DisA nucleotide-binding domain protein [Geobacteraceae bacterium]